MNGAYTDDHAYIKHEHLLFARLCRAKCDFINARPHLRACPSLARRRAVSEVVSARKTILTSNAGRHLPDMKPITKDREVRLGFSVRFQKNFGSILCQSSADGSIGPLRLEVAPRKLAAPSMPIRLRRQKDRQAFLSRCVEVPTTTGCKLEPPNEFAIRRDQYGDWYLLLPVQVDKGEIKQGPVILPPRPNNMACDPGVRTPWSVYTSAGQAVDIGSAKDKRRLDKLRELRDDLQRQLDASKGSNSTKRKNGKKRNRKRRKLRRRVKNASRKEIVWCTTFIAVLPTSSPPKPTLL